MELFEEFLHHAIGLEREASELYKKMANNSSAPEIKKVFAEMAAVEEGHKKQLEQILAKGELPKKQFYPDPDLKIADYVVEVDLTRDDLSYDEALIIGMKLEKTSQELYKKLSRSVVDHPELKGLFDYLAAEEAKHKHSFEAKFDDRQ